MGASVTVELEQHRQDGTAGVSHGMPHSAQFQAVFSPHCVQRLVHSLIRASTSSIPAARRSAFSSSSCRTWRRYQPCNHPRNSAKCTSSSGSSPACLQSVLVVCSQLLHGRPNCFACTRQRHRSRRLGQLRSMRFCFLPFSVSATMKAPTLLVTQSSDARSLTLGIKHEDA